MLQGFIICQSFILYHCNLSFWDRKKIGRKTFGSRGYLGHPIFVTRFSVESNMDFFSRLEGYREQSFFQHFTSTIPYNNGTRANDNVKYCKATIIHQGSNFTNSQIFRASWKLDAVKIKFLYYIILLYSII